ncbi:hypothetical protein [Butyricimonas synergistica]|uniref:hypothetical protein n=1 Tax=Butyricimonas synergistica TaxID=544644 RepID=UPI0003695664|nr:hypothetical protein [Butyricimonas synergistica]
MNVFDLSLISEYYVKKALFPRSTDQVSLAGKVGKLTGTLKFFSPDKKCGKQCNKKRRAMHAF